MSIVRMRQRRKILMARAFALLLAAMAATIPRAAAAAELSLLDIRFGDHTETTRVVLDLSGPTRYRAFALSQPDRIVVDMQPMTARVAASGRARTGLVLGYRFARYSASASRLVLDVAAPARIERSFLLPPDGGLGHRLVIDLARASTPAAAPGRSVATAATKPRTPVPRARPGPRRPRTIAVDAGHGGADPGAIGVNGVYEKDLTLPYARALKTALEAVPGYRVVLTRDRDKYIPLRRRIAIARAADADLFISLHVDSLKNRAMRGASVYTLSETASDKEAAALAAKENRSDIIAGVDLRGQNDEVTTGILIDLTQRETKNRSARYANLVLAEIRKSARVLKRSHRFAGFAVLKAPDVPSILVELGYLSNRDDVRYLSSASGRRALVAAIVRATQAYFRQIEALE